MEELDTDGLGSKDRLEMVRINPILADEPLEDMQSLGGKLIDATVLKEVGGGVRCIFYQPCIHEVLTHGLGHFAGHGECRRSGGRDYS